MNDNQFDIKTLSPLIKNVAASLLLLTFVVKPQNKMVFIASLLMFILFIIRTFVSLLNILPGKYQSYRIQDLLYNAYKKFLLGLDIIAYTLWFGVLIFIGYLMISQEGGVDWTGLLFTIPFWIFGIILLVKRRKD